MLNADHLATLSGLIGINSHISIMCKDKDRGCLFCIVTAKQNLHPMLLFYGFESDSNKLSVSETKRFVKGIGDARFNVDHTAFVCILKLPNVESFPILEMYFLNKPAKNNDNHNTRPISTCYRERKAG